MREVVHKLLDLPVDEISIGDTIGVATPAGVYDVVETLYDSGVTRGVLALHLHDTRGTALANVYAGLECGITTFDSSAGGLGGCPYAPGASGNLATEDLLYMLEGLGVETGVTLSKSCRGLAVSRRKRSGGGPRAATSRPSGRGRRGAGRRRVLTGRSPREIDRPAVRAYLSNTDGKKDTRRRRQPDHPESRRAHVLRQRLSN